MQFEEYMRAQRPALMRFATVLTGRTWLAEDVVSDVLGKAFERWDSIAATDHPHAYVRRMVVNEYLSWQRRAKRRAPLDDEPGAPTRSRAAPKPSSLRRARPGVCSRRSRPWPPSPRSR